MLMLLPPMQMTKAATTMLLRVWPLTNKQFTQTAAKFFPPLFPVAC
jgi:hypothetical protein